MGTQKFNWKEMTLGTCYYPEHWDKKLWEDDLRRMLSAGIETIRIAEFAWSKVEPREGEYTFEFWDEFLDLCLQKKMKVIFCTPIATPPAWLTSKYPEVLNSTIDGTLYRHGMRCNYNYNSEKYRELSCKITEVIAEHYAKHPMIVGWQLGNEQNCETDKFYSESDTKAFRVFLQKKYGSLEELNRAWGTAFWNEDYTEWEQVFVPRVTVPGNNNPHMLLDYDRFISDSAISYMKLQADILRKYIKPGDFITTNGLFGNLDNHRLEKEVLDVYTYDSYPNFGFTLDRPEDNDQKLKDRWWSKMLTETRSICPHFGIMEQESGALGWNYRMESPAPKPGQLSLWAMQSIAHGADYVSFFRWRTCTFSTEMYWHGILDYDNRDNRKLKEVKKLSKKVANIQEICGTDFVASFALLKDYDNEFDANHDTWHGRIARPSEVEIFAASQLNHTPMDIVYITDDTKAEELKKYKVVMYPHAEILTPVRAKMLEDYVKEGGTLIIGARTGQKDIDGHCVMRPMPGFLDPLCGADVKEFTFVGKEDGEISMNWDGDIVPTGIFNDVLQIDDTSRLEASGNVHVLATYLGNYYQGSPALVETRVGKGRVLQFGGTFTRQNVKKFFEYSGILESFSNVLSIPEEIELCVRTDGEKKYFILLNYSPQRQYVGLFKEMKDIETGEKVNGLLTMQAYETLILGEL